MLLTFRQQMQCFKTLPCTTFIWTTVQIYPQNKNHPIHTLNIQTVGKLIENGCVNNQKLNLLKFVFHRIGSICLTNLIAQTVDYMKATSVIMMYVTFSMWSRNSLKRLTSTPRVSSASDPGAMWTLMRCRGLWMLDVVRRPRAPSNCAAQQQNNNNHLITVCITHSEQESEQFLNSISGQCRLVSATQRKAEKRKFTAKV